MKVHYRAASGRLVFELEAGSQKDIFEGIADLQEIFESDSVCGLCHSPEIQFRVREVKSNKYYELRCQKCNGQFAFGQNKVGGALFPKRRDENGVWLPNRGWFKWTPKEDAA